MCMHLGHGYFAADCRRTHPDNAASDSDSAAPSHLCLVLPNL